LATFYEKIKDTEKEIQNYYKKYSIYSSKFEEEHEKTLKVKKSLGVLFQKYKKIPEAIKIFEEILECE
jgi:hypothetical protein